MFLMAMPVNRILVIYVILCILSYDFNKLTMLYIHVHISSSMTNKSGLTFFLSIKYLSVCLSKVVVTSPLGLLGPHQHYGFLICLVFRFRFLHLVSLYNCIEFLDSAMICPASFWMCLVWVPPLLPLVGNSRGLLFCLERLLVVYSY